MYQDILCCFWSFPFAIDRWKTVTQSVYADGTNSKSDGTNSKSGGTNSNHITAIAITVRSQRRRVWFGRIEHNRTSCSVCTGRKNHLQSASYADWHCLCHCGIGMELVLLSWNWYSCLWRQLPISVRWGSIIAFDSRTSKVIDDHLCAQYECSNCIYGLIWISKL